MTDGDTECTCCGGTGITYQTERRCACQPAPTLAEALALPEIAALVADREAAVHRAEVAEAELKRLKRDEEFEAWAYRCQRETNDTRAKLAKMQDDMALLVEAGKALEKAATGVERRGATVGPQWTHLTIALLQARTALSRIREGGE